MMIYNVFNYKAMKTISLNYKPFAMHWGW